MKNKVLLLLLSVILLIPFGVNATSSLSLSCDKETAKPGESITCDLKLTTDGKLEGGTGTLKLDSNNVSYTFKSTNSMQFNETNGKFAYAVGSLTGNIDVAKLTINMSEDKLAVGQEEKVKIDFTDLKLSIEGKDEFSLDPISKEVTFKNTAVKPEPEPEVKPENDSEIKPENDTEVKSETEKNDNVKNPSTSDINVIMIILVLITTIGISFVAIKKLKKN